MRCQFCGWDNPESHNKCEKCGKTLADYAGPGAQPAAGLPQAGGMNSRPTNLRNGEPFSPKATVRENQGGGRTDACPRCGYQLEQGKCAACGYGAEVAKPEAAPSVAAGGNFGRATVRPVRKKVARTFRLTPLSEKDGKPEGESLVFEGEQAVLNRANLDAKNDTLTSREQARVVWHDGRWLVEDRSELRTTFVQAARPVELQPGDLLLMGNQLYRFDA